MDKHELSEKRMRFAMHSERRFNVSIKLYIEIQRKLLRLIFSLPTVFLNGTTSGYIRQRPIAIIYFTKCILK